MEGGALPLKFLQLGLALLAFLPQLADPLHIGESLVWALPLDGFEVFGLARRSDLHVETFLESILLVVLFDSDQTAFLVPDGREVGVVVATHQAGPIVVKILLVRVEVAGVFVGAGASHVAGHIHRYRFVRRLCVLKLLEVGFEFFVLAAELFNVIFRHLAVAVLQRHLGGGVVAQSVYSLHTRVARPLGAGTQLVIVLHKRVFLDRSVLCTSLSVPTLPQEVQVNLVTEDLIRSVNLLLGNLLGLAGFTLELALGPTSGGASAVAAVTFVRRGGRRSRETLVHLLFLEIVLGWDPSVVHLTLPDVVFQYFDFLSVKRVYAVIMLGGRRGQASLGLCILACRAVGKGHVDISIVGESGALGVEADGREHVSRFTVG